jgi:hypothetical protein
MCSLGENFRHLLRQAKEHFEAAQTVAPQGAIISDHVLRMTIVHGMLDSVLFLCHRANRIAKQDPESVKALGVDVDHFTALMKDVVNVRNVSEHWADVNSRRQPKPHQHTMEGAIPIAVDELGLIIGSPTEMYIGALNVHDVYRYITQVLNEMKPRTYPPGYPRR